MGYQYLKLFHVIAVMIFMGNIITGLFWMSFAVKTKDLKIINHTMKGIRKADRYFTIPGVIIILIGGFSAAIHASLPILHTGWILWSIIMFSVSGIAFSIKLVPLQKKLYNITLNTNEGKEFNWKAFNKLYLEWDIWGIVAMVTPLAAFIMMVLKIPK